jgi:FtsZ-interacting cell division protein ZipA
MDLGGGNWAILNIVGPLLLAAVLLWALLRNRKSRNRDVDRTEQGTREVYREEEEKRRTGDDARS